MELLYVILISLVSITVLIGLLLLAFKLFNRHHYPVPPTDKPCENVCGYRTCSQYQDRLRSYNGCLNCKSQGKCWSEPQSNCINCSSKDLSTPCYSQDNYGCQNPAGYTKPDVPPINPKYNNCQLCWKN